MAILGNKTINYAVYDRTNGKSEFVADTVSYKRPPFEMLSDTVKGAGIMGEINLPTMTQIGSMEAELAFKRTNAKAVELCGQKSHTLEIRWVTDVLDSPTGEMKTSASKEIIKGHTKKMDMGSIETNASNDATLALEVTYYHYILDGRSMLEIDKLNNVFKVLGVDYAAAIREAL